MIALFTLLLMATAPGVAPLPAITIDPCVEVDAEEVRRLTAIELSSWRGTTSLGALDVIVSCEDGVQEVRLTNRTSGRVAVRSIDLSAAEGGDRDAKTRELALAIAELLRRAEAGLPPAAPPLPTEPPPAVTATAPPPTTPVSEPWGAELGASAVVAGWTGGEVLFGADVAQRVHVGRWLIAELRVGGRRTRTIDLETGAMDGSGVAGALGLALDATPGLSQIGVSFGARLGGDWLRYAAVDPAGGTYGGMDAFDVSAAATTTAFVMFSKPVCLTLDAAVGGALHSIDLREDGRSISGASGLLLSSAVGLAAHF